MTSALLNCTICKNTFDDPYMTNCGHTYCNTCISGWIKRKHTCKICKTANPTVYPNSLVRDLVEEQAKKVTKARQKSLEMMPTNPLANLK